MDLGKVAKTGATLVGGWLLKKGGEKASDAIFRKGELTVRNKASAGEYRKNAQRHARQIGGQWSGPVLVDREDRWVVWDRSGAPHEIYPQTKPALAKPELATHKDFVDFVGPRYDPPPHKEKSGRAPGGSSLGTH